MGQQKLRVNCSGQRKSVASGHASVPQRLYLGDAKTAIDVSEKHKLLKWFCAEYQRAVAKKGTCASKVFGQLSTSHKGLHKNT